MQGTKGIMVRVNCLRAVIKKIIKRGRLSVNYLMLRTLVDEKCSSEKSRLLEFDQLKIFTYN